MKNRRERRSVHAERASSASGKVAPDLRGGKRLLFTGIMLLVPITAVIILELVLRASHYGGNLELVVTKKFGDRTFNVINRGVARRYFAQSGVTVPEPSEDLFTVTKSATTKRIFCLGESTMAGFPYEFNATAPSFLRDRLQNLLPQYTIEVVNVGLSAVGSYVVRDFVGQLMDYKPDLIIIYLGHNEFYGIYGVGSAVQARSIPWLTRLNISLLKFKSFLLLRDFYGKIQNWLSSSRSQDTSPTLMQQMVGNDQIPYGSELYRLGRRIYRENMLDILEEAKNHGVQVLVSALVSNVRDQEPFRSVSPVASAGERHNQGQRLIDSAEQIERGTFPDLAAQMLSSAVALDSSNAMGYYKLGKELLRTGRVDAARKALLRAKDLDALRFRMSEDFQTDLRDICRSLDVPVAAVDSAFQTSSPDGLIGKELILEHLHPNIRGYFLMAKTWCQAIAQSGYLAPTREWQWSRDTTDERYMALSTVSFFDSLQGAIKVRILTHRWPFADHPELSTFVPTNGAERIVYQYVQKKVAWSDARYQLAEYYAGKNDYEGARRECLAISKLIPFYYQPLLRVADYYRMEGRNSEAKLAYLRCIQADDNPFAHMKLGIILLEEERNSESASQIETALGFNSPKEYTLPLEALGTARYLLGVCYAKLGRLSQARDNLERALSIQPSLGEARDLLQRLPQLSTNEPRPQP